MRKRTRAERCHYEDECRKALLLKRARHCGLTANGRSQANRGFSCVRNVNYCFARCAAKTYNHSPLGELVRMPLQRVSFRVCSGVWFHSLPAANGQYWTSWNWARTLLATKP